jgi:hypothetical protein
VVVAKGKMATRELAAGVESRHVCRLVTGPAGPSQFDFFLLFSFSTRRVVLGRLGNLNLTRAGNSKFLPKKKKQNKKQQKAQK